MKKLLTIGLISILSVALIFSFAFAKSEKSAWLGVVTQTVDHEIADAFDLDVEYGAIINEIASDSPAERAGLLEDDIIIAFNSQKVYDYDDLLDFIEDSSPDDNVTITVMRENNKMDFDITLDTVPRRSKRDNWRGSKYHIGSIPSIPSIPKMPDMPQMPDIPKIRTWTNTGDPDFNYSYSYGSSTYIGVELAELTDQLRDYFGIEDDKGVLVSAVKEDSPAEKAGIKAGDIIIEADNYDVEDFRDLKETIQDKEEGETVRLKFVRDKAEQTIDVTVEEDEDRNVIIYNAPDISMQFPQNKRDHAKFLDNMNRYFDSDEYKAEMEQLAKELADLKRELKKNKDYNKDSAEYQNQMEKLKRELKSQNSDDSKKLKDELEQLKKELKALEKRLDD